MPKSKLAKIREMRKKYKDGKTCPVCFNTQDIEKFRFSPGTPFRSNCNTCNKLITTIATIHRKYNKDNSYCQSRIDSAKLTIRIAELIEQNPDYSDIRIAKIIKGVELT